MSEKIDKIDLLEALKKLDELKITTPEMISKYGLTGWAIKYTFYLLQQLEKATWDLEHSDTLIENSKIITPREQSDKFTKAHIGITAVHANLKRVFKENFKIPSTECIHPPIVQIQDKKNNTCLMCGHEYSNA